MPAPVFISTAPMKTNFAPAQRLNREALDADISAVAVNPVIDSLLNTVSGLLAVLNEHRQILAINDAFLKMLGIDDADRALGLRPGEAVGCVHRDAAAGGCGTSVFCTTCGAAIAMAACLSRDESIEKECAITIDANGIKHDLFLRVRACPISVDGRRLILLFLQDITRQQQWEALGRVFFHDLSNIIYGLVGSTEIMLDKTTEGNREMAQRVHRLSLRLAKEVQMQKHLTQMADADYQPMIQPMTVQRIFDELEASFANHPAAMLRSILFVDRHLKEPFKSDFYLVVRVLTNMMTNALEATDKGKSIKVWAMPEGRSLSFYVWNHQAIAENVVNRVFQRNISTKANFGRGLGTYSMKLFGETFLKGRIDFTSSEAQGTTFCFRLPVSPVDRGSGLFSQA